MEMSKKKKEHLEKVMNVMTEEQLESLFFLMQEMFMEVVMGITPEEDNSDDSNDSNDSDDQTFDDNNPQPRIEKIDSPVDEEIIHQIRAVNSIKRKANDAVSNWMNDLFQRPEKKKL